MSTRRGTTVSSLWMELDCEMAAAAANASVHGRCSPPPRDVEGAHGYDGYADPETARRFANGELTPCLGPQMQPPRLQSESATSRIVICLAFATCVAVAFLVGGLLLQLPGVDQARGALADVITPPQTAAAPTVAAALGAAHRPARAAALPAILKRLQLLQRARAPEHGADLQSIQAAFPQWGAPDAWALEHVARDVALALAVLAERVPDPGAAHAAPPPPPHEDQDEDL